jgi:hypothetical protein
MEAIGLERWGESYCVMEPMKPCSLEKRCLWKSIKRKIRIYILLFIKYSPARHLLIVIRIKIPVPCVYGD